MTRSASALRRTQQRDSNRQRQLILLRNRAGLHRSLGVGEEDASLQQRKAARIGGAIMEE